MKLFESLIAFGIILVIVDLFHFLYTKYFVRRFINLSFEGNSKMFLRKNKIVLFVLYFKRLFTAYIIFFLFAHPLYLKYSQEKEKQILIYFFLTLCLLFYLILLTIKDLFTERDVSLSVNKGMLFVNCISVGPLSKFECNEVAHVNRRGTSLYDILLKSNDYSKKLTSGLNESESREIKNQILAFLSHNGLRT